MEFSTTILTNQDEATKKKTLVLSYTVNYAYRKLIMKRLQSTAEINKSCRHSRLK